MLFEMCGVRLQSRQLRMQLRPLLSQKAQLARQRINPRRALAHRGKIGDGGTKTPIKLAQFHRAGAQIRVQRARFCIACPKPGAPFGQPPPDDQPNKPRTERAAQQQCNQTDDLRFHSVHPQNKMGT